MSDRVDQPVWVARRPPWREISSHLRLSACWASPLTSQSRTLSCIGASTKESAPNNLQTFWLKPTILGLNMGVQENTSIQSSYFFDWSPIFSVELQYAISLGHKQAGKVQKLSFRLVILLYANASIYTCLNWQILNALIVLALPSNHVRTKEANPPQIFIIYIYLVLSHSTQKYQSSIPQRKLHAYMTVLKQAKSCRSLNCPQLCQVASMSNVTSIWGAPFGAGGKLSITKSLRKWLSWRMAVHTLFNALSGPKSKLHVQRSHQSCLFFNSHKAASFEVSNCSNTDRHVYRRQWAALQNVTSLVQHSGARSLPTISLGRYVFGRVCRLQCYGMGTG